MYTEPCYVRYSRIRRKTKAGIFFLGGKGNGAEYGITLARIEILLLLRGRE